MAFVERTEGSDERSGTTFKQFSQLNKSQKISEKKQTTNDIMRPMLLREKSLTVGVTNTRDCIFEAAQTTIGEKKLPFGLSRRARA